MTTYNNVLISGLKAAGIKRRDLPQFFDGWDSGISTKNRWDHGSDYVAFDEPRTTIEDGRPIVRHGEYVTNKDEATTSGESKYRHDELAAWIVAFSGDHHELTIIWTQSWDDEDGGREVDVYAKGEHVPERSEVNAMVPFAYAEYIAEAKVALARLAEMAERGSSDDEIEAGQDVARQLERLIEGIHG